MSCKPLQLVLIVALPTVFLSAGCGKQSGRGPESSQIGEMPRELLDNRGPRPAHSFTKSKEAAEIKAKRARSSTPEPVSDEIPKDQDFEKVVWGREIMLDEIFAMAYSGRIREMEWHVMPNIIRIIAMDGGFSHFRNEDKGADLRNMLINAGVRIGEGGIVFRHVF